MQVEVVRPFKTGGRTLLPGDKVDATSWLHTESLIRLRYIRKVDDAPKKRTRKAED